MTVDSGTAKIIQNLSNNTPKTGGEASGSSNLSSRDDHVHPLIILIGIYVDPAVPHIPQMESTSTLCFVASIGFGYLAWDNVQDIMTWVGGGYYF